MTIPLDTVHPDGWPAAPGYAHATVTTGGRLLHLAAVAGVDPTTFEFDPDLDLLGQWRQAIANLTAIVEAAGASLQQVASIRCYVADLDAYGAVARDVGRLHRDTFEGHRPAATLLGVVGFADPSALVEIEAVVELPDDA